MKTIITTLTISVILFLTSTNYSQNKVSRIPQDKLPAKPIQLSENTQAKKLVEFIIQYYGKSFKFYQELLTGKYETEVKKTKGGKQYFLKIFTDGKSSDKSVEIRLNQITIREGNNEFVFEKNDMERYVNFNEFNSMYKRRLPNAPISIIDKEKILFDQMIMKSDDIPPEYWRILNRTVTENLDDQNGDPFAMFRLAQEGVWIPYADGTQSKMLVIDNRYHTLVYFDSNIDWSNADQPVNKVYGYFGLGYGQFMNPTGITLGRIWGGNRYPLYIADQFNFRIVNVDYVIQDYPQIGYIDENSFLTFNNIILPYDITFAGGRPLTGQPNEENSDKLWVSEAHSFTPFISCYNESGILIQRFRGYYDNNTGEFYVFLPGTASRLSVSRWQPDGRRAVSFIDNIRNCLVTCKIVGTGEASSVQNGEDFYIRADDILFFPDDERINSVKFQESSPLSMMYPYAWVTSSSKIHCLKMNSDLIRMQYLASTSKPFNTDKYFHNLMNTMSSQGYGDMFTIEVWNYDYGIRRYLPFADIYGDSLFNYCYDGTDQMKLKAVFTNDCWVELKAERRNIDGGWDSVKIKKVSGETVNDYTAILYRLAGGNGSWDNDGIPIQLELPESDYLLGGRVRLHLKLMPDNVNPYAGENNYVRRDYEVNVIKCHLPIGGGCPFIYVQNTDTVYKLDNNILHRSEFPEYAGQDIRDFYKIQVEPGIIGGHITISTVENESDHSYFDRIKLYAVDYPDNNELGVTENNDIVLYAPVSVISPDTAYLNGNKISNYIKYPDGQGVRTFINDSLYAHYPAPQMKIISAVLSRNSKEKEKTNSPNYTSNPKEKKSDNDKNRVPYKSPTLPGNTSVAIGSDSIAIIALIGNLDTLRPIASKNWAGTLTGVDNNAATNIVQFARREQLSEVIIPVFETGSITQEYIDHIGLKLQSDAKIKYLAAVNVSYTYPAMYEATLDEASLITLSSTTDILSKLQNQDNVYAEMSSDSMITLRFSSTNLPPIQPGYKRAYLIETIGHYTVNNSGAKNANLVINNVPLKNQLYNNYPNPFNPLTKIKFDIKKDNFVKITVYNILGQEVKVLINEFRKAGSYITEFDGTNLASGVYFYRIEAGDFVEAKKMVLIK